MLPPKAISMSRGRVLHLSGPYYYQDILTGIAQEILAELAEIEKVNLPSLPEEDFEQVVSVTQIRLLNELYYCLGQLRAVGMELEVKQAIQDLRDIWNRYIDQTNRPEALKFQVDPAEERVQ